MAAEQVTIKYVGLPVDDVRYGMQIPAIFSPTGSYVDSNVYENGHEGEGDAAYGKSIYATNVDGWGKLFGLLPMASTPTKFAWFEMAIMQAIQAKEAGEEIPTVTVDIEDQNDKLWWLQMAPNFVGLGFYITVAGEPFGQDPDASDDNEPSNP